MFGAIWYSLDVDARYHLVISITQMRSENVAPRVTTPRPLPS
jgi:hypothetical protein